MRTDELVATAASDASPERPGWTRHVRWISLITGVVGYGLLPLDRWLRRYERLGRP